MAVYRVGLIGLASTDSTYYSGGDWGLHHLKALRASPNFEITAICNSTVESAKKSIEFHKIAGAKAYGNAEDLAADPNVDLIVVSVFVGHHYKLTKAALLHKKHVYVEFPVGLDSKEVVDLHEIARDAGVKVAVGAQAVSEPALKKVKELVNIKAIGDVSFSLLSASLPFSTADGIPETFLGSVEIESGISRTKVLLGHVLAAQSHILGSYQSIQPLFKIVESKATILGSDGSVCDKEYKVTAPDTILMQGVLEGGIASSLTLRTARTTVGDVGFRWIIAGPEGEIEVTGGPGIIQMGGQNLKILLRKWNQDAVDIGLEDLESGEEDWLKQVAQPAANIARVYDSFAKGDESGYFTLAEGLKLHKVLEEIHGAASWAS